MPDNLIEWDKDGRCITCKNIIGSPDGGIRRWEGDINGVLVQVFPGYDEDGNPKHRRFVTMLVADPEMEEEVREEANKVIKSIG
jgi:hypothetical protein